MHPHKLFAIIICDGQKSAYAKAAVASLQKELKEKNNSFFVHLPEFVSVLCMFYLLMVL